MGAAHYVSHESLRRGGAGPRRRAEAEAEPELGKSVVSRGDDWVDGLSRLLSSASFLLSVYLKVPERVWCDFDPLGSALTGLQRCRLTVARNWEICNDTRVRGRCMGASRLNFVFWTLVRTQAVICNNLGTLL